MRQCDAVIGLGFGDEGKGFFTSYLCSKRCSYPTVVRYCGGPQAGHTVRFNDTYHTFSSFGSGSVHKSPTYWSKFCPIHPRALLREFFDLQSKGIDPTLEIHPMCPIITPFDEMYTKLSSSYLHHGTVGVGVGATIQREEDHYSLTFMDIFYPHILKIKLDAITRYYSTIIPSESVMSDFTDACKQLIELRGIIIDKSNKRVSERYDALVFEGSQGLLLDQEFGFFPHVTRSNTGLKNIKKLVDLKHVDVYLITRAYQTRHGNGYMTNEGIPHNIKIDGSELNIENEYQGKFRSSLLDVSLLKYVIEKESLLKEVRSVHLVVTCLDHILNEYRFTYNEEIFGFSDKITFLRGIEKRLGYKVAFFSESANIFDIKQVGWTGV